MKHLYASSHCHGVFPANLVQGNGTLQVSSMARLQQAAWECEQRAAEAAARQEGQASSSGRGTDSPLREEEEEEEEGQGLESGATSQATRFRWVARH